MKSATVICRIDPPMPVVVELDGECVKAMAHAWIDYGFEHNLIWLVALDDSRQFWCVSNKHIRCQDNITMGRPPTAEAPPFCGIGLPEFEGPPELAKRKEERQGIWDSFLEEDEAAPAEETRPANRVCDAVVGMFEREERYYRTHVATGVLPTDCFVGPETARFLAEARCKEPETLTHINGVRIHIDSGMALGRFRFSSGGLPTTDRVERPPAGGPDPQPWVHSLADKDKDKLKKMLEEGISKHGLAGDTIKAQMDAAEQSDEWAPVMVGPGRAYIAGYRCRKCNCQARWPLPHLCLSLDRA